MIDFNRFTLQNGLQVIHHYDPSTPLTCINILYDVGARDEHPDHTGFAHLFEHLMFGGSVNIPNYDEPLQKAGGENNAFTNNDITNYYLTVPSENLETGFWLESDRMLSLAFTEKSLEVQRSVVIEEFKQRYLNQPYGDVWLLLKPLAYKTHPYRWNTIGKEISHIENATMQQVKDFFHYYYLPSNAIMVVAGSCKEEKVRMLAEKWFGAIPGGTKPQRNLPAEPAQTSGRKEVITRDVPADALYMAWHMTSRPDPLWYHFDMISDILSNGKSSRLYLNLVKDRKLFTEINAYVSGDLDPGLFVVSGKINVGISPEEAERAVWQEIDKIKFEAIPDKELQKIKNKMESLLAFSNTNILNKAMNLAYYQLLGDADWANHEGEKYNLVTASGLMQTAKSFLVPENCNTLYYLSKNLHQ